MTDIDPETGLAQLPEGYFWRVKEGFFRDGPIFYLRIVESKKEEVTWLSWFGKQKSKIIESEETLHEGYVWAHDDFSTKGFAKFLTPEDLKRSSVKELKRYLDKVDAITTANKLRSQTEKFLGDYPPKSINREETE